MWSSFLSTDVSQQHNSSLVSSVHTWISFSLQKTLLYQLFATYLGFLLSAKGSRLGWQNDAERFVSPLVPRSRSLRTGAKRPALCRVVVVRPLLGSVTRVAVSALRRVDCQWSVESNRNSEDRRRLSTEKLNSFKLPCDSLTASDAHKAHGLWGHFEPGIELEQIADVQPTVFQLRELLVHKIFGEVAERRETGIGLGRILPGLFVQVFRHRVLVVAHDAVRILDIKNPNCGAAFSGELLRNAILRVGVDSRCVCTIARGSGSATAVTDASRSLHRQRRVIFLGIEREMRARRESLRAVLFARSCVPMPRAAARLSPPAVAFAKMRAPIALRLAI